MTNKSSSKQHGLVGNIRPKSKDRNRRRKEKARELKAQNEVPVLGKGYKVAGSTTAKKAAPKKAEKKEEKAA